MHNLLKTVSKIPITRLEAIAFIVGMAILTFELTAARIVAPYLGDTIYTWTSIIGVILAALAAGYYAGGIWADARKRDIDVVLFLMAGAALIAAMNIVKDVVLESLAAPVMPLQLQAFLASSLLFAIPTFMLGVVSPYLSRLSISSVATSGRHLSRIDAAGTIGSLAGTFLTGYVLFGLIGSRHLLTFIAISLVLASLLIKARVFLYWRLGLLGAIIFSGFFSPAPLLQGFIAEIDTAYSRIIVRTVPMDGREVKVYQTAVDGLQSGVYTDGSKDQPFPYIRGFSYLSDLRAAGSRYLIIGGGAFTFPEYLARKESGAVVDTVEIDNRLPEIGQQYFNFSKPANLHIIHEDGRTFLNRNHAKYNMIFLDAFGSLVPPFQLLTREAAQRMHAALDGDGIFVANVVSATQGAKGDMIRHLYSTFKAEFPHVAVYPVQPQPDTLSQNLLLIASMQPLDAQLLAGATKAHPELATMLQSPASLPFNSKLIMTDDFAPVEQLAL